jgi:hypothetical protein
MEELYTQFRYAATRPQSPSNPVWDKDWRDNIIHGLTEKGLEGVMPNPDVVVGYEGLTI